MVLKLQQKGLKELHLQMECLGKKWEAWAVFII
jgi:hypothetical protein